MAKKYYVGDVGTKIRVDIGGEILNPTVLELQVKKPNSVEVIWPATLEDLHFLEHIVQAGDWDIAGRYLLTVYINSPSWSGLGETTSFEVYNKYK